METGPALSEVRPRKDETGSLSKERKAQPSDTRWKREAKAKPTSGETSTGATERRQQRANGRKKERASWEHGDSLCRPEAGDDVFYEMAFRELARMAFSPEVGEMALRAS